MSQQITATFTFSGSTYTVSIDAETLRGTICDEEHLLGEGRWDGSSFQDCFMSVGDECETSDFFDAVDEAVSDAMRDEFPCVELTAERLFGLYGVEVPASWQAHADLLLQIGPGICRAVDGRDLGDTSSMEPSTAQFLRLRAELAEPDDDEPEAGEDEEQTEQPRRSGTCPDCGEVRDDCCPDCGCCAECGPCSCPSTGDGKTFRVYIDTREMSDAEFAEWSDSPTGDSRVTGDPNDGEGEWWTIQAFSADHARRIAEERIGDLSAKIDGVTSEDDEDDEDDDPEQAATEQEQQEPARSIRTIIDSYVPGSPAHALAQRLQRHPEQMTERLAECLRAVADCCDVYGSRSDMRATEATESAVYNLEQAALAAGLPWDEE